MADVAAAGAAVPVVVAAAPLLEVPDPEPVAEEPALAAAAPGGGGHPAGGLLPGGWGELRRRNHDKVCEARRVLSSRLGLDGEPCPEALLGSMATLSLPDGPAMPLMDALFHDHHIEVPVLHWPGPNRRFFRVSAQLYNAPTDYERLGHALSLLLNLP